MLHLAVGLLGWSRSDAAHIAQGNWAAKTLPISADQPPPARNARPRQAEQRRTSRNQREQPPGSRRGGLAIVPRGLYRSIGHFVLAPGVHVVRLLNVSRFGILPSGNDGPREPDRSVQSSERE